MLTVENRRNLLLTTFPLMAIFLLLAGFGLYVSSHLSVTVLTTVVAGFLKATLKLESLPLVSTCSQWHTVLEKGLFRLLLVLLPVASVVVADIRKVFR